MVAGTWSGMSMPEGTDSVAARWTITGSGTMGAMMLEGAKDSVHYMVVFDADSLVATSDPYPSTTTAGAPMVFFRSVGRLVDGKQVGTYTTMLADMRDSVVARGRWEATRQP
jgi:phage gp37-like protein